MVIQRLPNTPLVKEVLYIGSAVPLETSEGLDAVQQPLRSRYPVENDDHIQGILAVLTIVPTGIQLKYKTDPGNIVLFPFSALTMCAAVRCIKTSNAATGEVSVRFVSLTSPEAGGLNSDRPCIFTAITRRTKGRQVLECHGFITESPKDAMDLVQWTSVMDKRSKMGSYSTLNSGVHSASATYEPSKGDTSFQADTASLPDFPVQLTPGESMTLNTSPAFYKEPPSAGYFYSTKNAQVKKYSLHKFGGSGSVADDSHSVILPGPDINPGYAASHYSASAIVPPSRPPIMVPLRPYIPPPQTPIMRPVLMAPAPMMPPFYAYPRPRFFSPPPPPATMLRARPVPVFLPPPPPSQLYYDGDPRARPRNRSFSSSSASSSSSSPDTSRVSGHASRKSRTHNAARDDSSVSSSRPRTPPTDYETSKGASHMSRRSEYYQRQNGLPYHNGTLPLPGYVPKKGQPLPANGYYMVPQYGYYGTIERPRSVPPYTDSKHSTKKKDKKSKKNKKEKKRGSKKHSAGNGLDESSDSLAGYHSELGRQNSENRQPRDFRRLENQFKHERAFSKSLQEETRHSVRGDVTHDAYTLNAGATQSNKEFPMY